MMDSLGRVHRWMKDSLNFYRIHLLIFSFVPLLLSIIFWASNADDYKVSYIDSLFVCVSSMTVTGLATIDLSPLTTWQQVMLFIQMCLGHPVAVSWIVVYVRKSYFRRTFGDIVLARRQTRALRDEIHPLSNIEVDKGIERPPLHQRITTLFRRRKNISVTPHDTSDSGVSESDRDHDSRRIGLHKLRPDMIRRMDKAPQLINPSGFISEGHKNPSSLLSPSSTANPRASPERMTRAVQSPKQLAFASGEVTRSPVLEPSQETSLSASTSEPLDSIQLDRKHPRRPSESGFSTFSAVPSDLRYPTSDSSHRYGATVAGAPTTPESTIYGAPERFFPRSPTVEFAATKHVNRHERKGSLANATDAGELMTEGLGPRRRSRSRSEADRTRQPLGTGLPLTYTTHTMHTTRTRTTIRDHTKVRLQDRGYGGFPMPHHVVGKIVHKVFPNLERTVTRTMTIPRTATYTSQAWGTGGIDGVGMANSRPVPYISFDALVGRNSVFHDLTKENIEELGGVEYRALTALLWLIGGYHIAIQVIAYVIIAPYISQAKWNPAFLSQPRYISPPWFALFQVVSAYTNTGTSLMDTSMIPFQTAYVMLVVMFILIIAGNTGFPILFRFMIWVLTKVVSKTSRSYETLHFLLDHPRRCYIYLFPSHQTWFLLTVLVLMILTDWLAFLVLDIGNPEIESVPLNTRVAIGFLQAAAVRAAGFATVSLAALAPAVKVLYVVMMYVAVYPVALSVRSTNVYEEKSLGIFEDTLMDDDMPEELAGTGSRAKIWGQYLVWHARRQLSFDMWWIGFALWLICIIERGQITNKENDAWFTIFQLIFEVVSAYGTVGLSLGLPTANYSFSGALKPLSKFILIIVMIRGRHRGLPVAIDRAVLLKGDDFPTNADTYTSDPVMADDISKHMEENGSLNPGEKSIPSASQTNTAGAHSSAGVVTAEPLGKHPGSVEHDTSIHSTHLPPVAVSSPVDKSRLEPVPEISLTPIHSNVPAESISQHRPAESEGGSSTAASGSDH